MTLEQVLAIAISALSVVVGTLWVRIDKELNECAEDRKSLRELITQVQK